MTERYVYVMLSGGRERRDGVPWPPEAVHDSLDAVLRSLRLNADDPTNEEAYNVDTMWVFRVQLGCRYFANAPINGRALLDGERWPTFPDEGENPS